MNANQWDFTCIFYEQIDEDSNSLSKVIKIILKTDYNRLILNYPVGNSKVMYNISEMAKFKVPNIKKKLQCNVVTNAKKR